MIILVDMDGVICRERPTFERSLAEPLPGARDAIDALRSQGHSVVVYTARSWAELEMTKHWLDTHGFVVDGIHMGKPIADRIIDDRAIGFAGWDSVLRKLTSPQESDVDTMHLEILREYTKNFLMQICSSESLKGPVLEVGPMTRTGKNSAVYNSLPGTFFDSRGLITERGIEYLSVDVDHTASPDICSDFTTLRHSLSKDSFGTIIMLSIIEHIPNLFDVPATLKHLLKPRGRAYIITPWNLRFHGPRPDCWRISDDGYEALFREDFDILDLTKIPAPDRPLSPVGLSLCIQKKSGG